MSTRPSVYPEWATTLSADGPLGGNNRVEPAAGDKITGFPYPMQPPREWFNWLYWMNYQWIEYLDEELISGGSSAFAQDNVTTTGLTFGYKAGIYYNQFTKAITEVAAGTIALTASSTNWIAYRPGTGIVKVVGTFSAGATAGDVPLWKAVTDGSGITALTDVRSTVDRNIVQFTATDKLLGRSTAGGGDAEEITCTAAGRAILDDATAADQRTTMGAAASGLITASGLTSQASKLIGRSSGSTGAVEEIALPSGVTITGGTLSITGAFPIVARSASLVTSQVDVGVTALPYDATTPTSSEGDEVFSLSHTASSATNILRIEAAIPYYNTNTTHVSASLIIDGEATARYAVGQKAEASSGGVINMLFEFVVGTTSATTYKIRVGTNSATACKVNHATYNFGGVSTATMVITELKA